MRSMDMARVLLQLSLRSLVAHWLKSLIVGGILLFGSALLIFGMTMLENIERTMRVSLTGSLIGDMQVHSDRGKDKLAFFEMGSSGEEDIGVIQNFKRVRKVLEGVGNVAAVIPMGADRGVIRPGGNEFDRQIEALRSAAGAGDTATLRAQRERIVQMASLLKEDFGRRAAVAKDQSDLLAPLATLDRVMGKELWQKLETEPESTLFFLETQLAALQTDESVIHFGYIGTDLQRFASAFAGFEMVDGQMVPEGQRGILFNQQAYERGAKNKTAHDLDEIYTAVVKGGKRIADDPALQENARKLQRFYKRLLIEMSPEDAAALKQDLQIAFGETKAELGSLLSKVLKVDDQNLQARYALFYKAVAPRIRLYKVRVGDVVTLRASSSSGYDRAVNVKLWGTFRFKGLDDSPLAGVYNLADMMTFRDLYGLLTPERKAELDAMRVEVGATKIARDDAEAALFGDGAAIEQTVAPSEWDGAPTFGAQEPADPRPFTQAEIESGTVLNAAVILKDASKMNATMRALTKANKAHRLGLTILPWEEVSGAIGQFTLVLRGILFVLVGFMFVVALVIINNSMLMATMDRIQEIGTMRAIGARRSFILWMYLIETIVLSVLSGLLGAIVAAIPILIWKKVGLAAPHEMLAFAFGGPALHPTPSAFATLIGLSLIFVVSILATLYPALIATRVQPIVAMQSRE